LDSLKSKGESPCGNAIAQCASVDEAAGIRNRSAQLEAYARIKDDKESQRQFGEIRLRACVRIGEISRDLDKVAGFKGNQYEVLPTDGKKQTKEEQLKEAGISTSTANRYEELADMGMQAVDEYVADAVAKNEPVTMKGYRKAPGQHQKALPFSISFVSFQSALFRIPPPVPDAPMLPRPAAQRQRSLESPALSGVKTTPPLFTTSPSSLAAPPFASLPSSSLPHLRLSARRPLH
jgi:hypothetical protein